MTYTLNFEDVKDKCKNLVPEIRTGLETKLLSKKIQKEMEEGVSLEEILHKAIPNMDMEELQEDIEALKKGVQKVYAAKDEEVDARWVKEHLNHVMLKMNDKERVRYLGNIILAEKKLHPNAPLEEETKEQIKAIMLSDEASEEDVQMLLELANEMLDNHAGLLTRVSWKAMEKRAYKLDHETIGEHITFGEEVSVAYAVALYIQQKCGKEIKADHMGQAELPAELIGSAAAATVESSRLMQLYCTGRMNKKMFLDKIKQLYTATMTFICEHPAALAVQGLLAVGLYCIYFSFLSLFLIEAPIVSMIIAAMLTSVLVIDEGLTYDIENTLNNIWNGLVEIWENIKDMYHRTIASWKGKTADVNEADIFDAEIDEILFEDEIDDEFENDEDVETDDEIEIVEDVEMDDEFENDEDLEEKEDEEESN